MSASEREREDGRAIAALLRHAWRRDESPLAVDDALLARLLPLLLDLGLAGLVWMRIDRRAPRNETRATLRDAFRLQSLHALLHEQQLARVAAAFARDDVDALIGKGWAIARAYPDAAMRPYGDIDVYVPVEQLARARATMRGFDSDEDVPVVDLHAGFAELRRPAAPLLARARALPLYDALVRLFAPEDHLRLLVAHFLRHGGCRPLWLCDIALAVEEAAAGFDWDQLLAPPSLPLDWVASTLGLARALLGADLSHAPRAIAEWPLASWLVPTMERQWGRRGFQAQGQRAPMADVVRRPQALVQALLRRWPNAIEASAGVGARFDEAPRLPVQLAECARRTIRFVLAPRD